MSTTTAEPTTAGAPDRKPGGSPDGALFAVLKPLASLRLTVVLFALAMVLVFFGTVAMMAQGLWSVVDDYFRSFVVWIPFDLIRRFGTVFFNDVVHLPKDASPWPGAFPFPAGWTLGGAMLVNLIAAHLVRFKLTWKRAGVILLHAGVILLMVGELVTGVFAVEATMTLKLDEASDFVDVTRQMEIAVTDSSAPDHDRVTVVPQGLLERPGVVSDPQLPFDLEILEYWKNTSLSLQREPGEGDVFPVASGAWAQLGKQREGAGVDTEARSDIPSARVRVLEKGTGKELGTHLLSLWFYPNFELNRRRFDVPPPAVEVGGKSYSLMLRNKRVYKPYSVKLLKFEHGKYPGTDIPKDFASTVLVTDAETGDNREVRIWMNNPLRYEGDSLYQFAVVGDDTGTVLQVVRNPGRLLPYLACSMIALGMLIHFGMRLRSSLAKRANAGPVARSGGVPQPLGRAAVIFPWAVLAVFAAWVGMKAVPPKPAANGVDYYALGKLPMREGGRVMPLDTLARTNLQALSGRTVVQDEKGETTATATQWLAAVLDSPDWADGPAAKAKVFKIEYDQLLGKLELPRRPGFYRYSLAEMRPKFAALQAEFEAVQAKRDTGKALDLYDAKVEELGRKLKQYQRLAFARELQLVPPQTDGGEWGTFRQVDQQVVAKLPEAEMADIREKAARRLADELEREFGSVEKIPPELRDRIRGRFMASMQEQLAQAARDRRQVASPAAGKLTAILNAARAGDGERFAAALADYRQSYLQHVPAGELETAEVEAYALDYLSPFYYAAFLYLIVIVLGLLSWLVWPVPLGRAAFLLALFTFVLHTAAIVTRVLVMGRPPVTNLYSSAVFIGWGAVGLCLVLERMHRNGVGIVIAGAVGAATMYLARFLGGSGDTMAMLQAVLDTNFWLATHVVAVTLGYTATLVAGAIAIVYIVRGLTGSLDATTSRSLGSMLYGVICFATLLSFVGTVLGGLWADYSWGRFWGWDPKENGAVLIVIWNALILHARWCGLVKTRGMAVLAVCGNIVTAWSWFGTNQLQIGLHSYGFDDRLASGCFWFWVSQAAVAGLGLIPLKYWRSYEAITGRPAPLPQQHGPHPARA
jgi:ABC-type transport system involved in cytochrome c biogenesis permease subunit